MALIASQWTLTWSGVSLLAPADLTEGEVKLPSGSGKYQEVAPVRSAYALRIGRGNVVQRMSFRRHVLCANAAQARIVGIQHVAALSNIGLALGDAPDALLTPITGGQWRLGNCKVTWAPQSSDRYGEHFICEYQLEFGAIFQLVAPPDPNPPPVVNNLVTDAGDNLVTNTGDTRVVNPG